MDEILLAPDVMTSMKGILDAEELFRLQPKDRIQLDCSASIRDRHVALPVACSPCGFMSRRILNLLVPRIHENTCTRQARNSKILNLGNL